MHSEDPGLLVNAWGRVIDFNDPPAERGPYGADTSDNWSAYWYVRPGSAPLAPRFPGPTAWRIRPTRALRSLQRVLGRHRGDVAVSEPADTGVGARRPAPGRQDAGGAEVPLGDQAKGEGERENRAQLPRVRGGQAPGAAAVKPCTIRARLRAAAPLGCCAVLVGRRAPLARTDSSPRVRCAEREARPEVRERAPSPLGADAASVNTIGGGQNDPLDNAVSWRQTRARSSDQPGSAEPQRSWLRITAGARPGLRQSHQRHSAPDAHQAPSARPAARRRRRLCGATSPARSPVAGRAGSGGGGSRCFGRAGACR